MADKDTIYTNPAPDAPITDTLHPATQYSGSTDSYSPYSLRNHKFAPHSTNTMKNQKKRENKIDDKVTNWHHPFPWCNRRWYPTMLMTKILTPMTPISHIHREIANSPPTLPSQWKPRKRRKIKLMIKTHLTPPLPLMQLSLIPPILSPNIMSAQTYISHIHW